MRTLLNRFAKATAILLGLAFPCISAPTSGPAGNFILNISTNVSQQKFKVSSGTITGQLSLPYLTPGQCQTTNAAGQVIGIACGSGAAAIAITTGSSTGFAWAGSSPTAVANLESTQFNVGLKGSATAYISLNQSSVTLQGNNLAATYLTNSSATATYLQLSSATANYLSISSATTTYFQSAGILPVLHGGTGTSSAGLIAGTNILSITGTWPNQTINAATQSGSGASGQINAAAQYDIPYYFVSGSSNVLDASNNLSYNPSSDILTLGGVSTNVHIPDLGNGPNFVRMSNGTNTIFSGGILTTDIPRGATNYAQINPTAQQSGTVYVSSIAASSMSITNSNMNIQINPQSGSGVTGYLWLQGNSSFASSKFDMMYSPLNDGTTFSHLLFTNSSGGADVLGWNFQDSSGVTQTSISRTGGVVTSTITVSSITVTNITIKGTCTGTGCGTGGTGGVTVYPATATATLPLGVSASTGVFSSTVTALAFAANGTGNLSVTENSLTGQIVLSTAGTGVTAGHCAMFGSSMSVVDAGAACGSGGGGSGGNLVNLSTLGSLPYYSFAGSSNTLSGSNNFQFNGTSVTAVSSVTINDIANGNNGGPSSNLGPGYLNVFKSNFTTGTPLLTIGDSGQGNQLVVNSQQPILAAEGLAPANVLYIATPGQTNTIYNNNFDANQGINFGNTSNGNLSGQLKLGTSASASGGAGISFAPNTVQEVYISSFGVTVSTGITVTSSVTLTSVGGAGLTLCGDSTHALAYTATTGLFSCQSITGTGGGSGGYALQPATVTIQANTGITASTVTVSTLTVNVQAVLPGATFYYNRAAGATTPSVNLSSVTIINGETINVPDGGGSTARIINQLDATNNSAGEIINTTGTNNGLIVNANGVNYGTNFNSGAFNVSCLGEHMNGNCGQIYNHGGAQSVLNGVWNIVQDSPTWNTVTEYIVASADNPQNGIRIDGFDYSTVEFIDTFRDGAGAAGGSGTVHTGKGQISEHNGQLRGEVRAADNSGFQAGWQIADSTAAGVMSIGATYGVPVSTLEVQGGVTIGQQIAGASGTGVTSPLNGLVVQGNAIFQASATVTAPALFKSSVTVNSTFTVTYATVNLNGVNYSFPSSGTIGNYLMYTSTNTLKWGAVAAAASSGGGYALQPATVTIQAAQGVTISSTVTQSLPSAVITATSTLTSTMSVVEVSVPANTAWVTETLPSAASFPGIDIIIYKVDSTTGAVRVQGALGDLIVSTGTWYLNARGQSVSLHSLGSNGWGCGVGGCIPSPARIYSTPFSQHNAYFVSADSAQVVCPVFIPTPIQVTGFTYDGQTGINAVQLSLGILDNFGNIVVSTGPVLGATGNQFLTTTPVNIAAGAYYIAIKELKAGSGIDGADTAGPGGATGCLNVDPGTLGNTSPISSFAGLFTLGTTPATAPAISIITSGGRQGY